MFSLINTLIEFYQLDTGEIKLTPSIFSPKSLFKEVAGSYGSLAKKKNILLTTTFSGLDTIVNGDHPRIRQVINNWLSNAFKFTAPEKYTWMRNMTTGSYVFRSVIREQE